jgi:hypothetical protein
MSQPAPSHRPPPIPRVFGRHTLIGDAIFTNATHKLATAPFTLLDPLPSLSDAAQPASPILGDIWQFNWVRNETPYMMCIPVHQHFASPLFSCLHFTRDFPLERGLDGCGWTLASSIVCDWTSLKRNLRVLLVAMHFMCL